jgi:fucose permease
MSVNGYYTPWYIFGGICMIVGFSLLRTVSTDTSIAFVYGALILAGVGTGAFAQAGYSVAQSKVEPKDIESTIGFISQGQLLGVIVAMAIAGSLFIDSSVKDLGKLLVGTSQEEIKSAIAGVKGDFFNTLSPDVKDQALRIIVKDMSQVYILGIVAGAVALLCGIFMKQEKLKLNAGGGM